MKQHLDQFKKFNISARLSLFVAALLLVTTGLTISNSLSKQEVRTRAASNSLSAYSSSAATCPTTDCTIDVGNFRLFNNLWGAPGATQSIFTNTDGSIGFLWNNSQSGYNYPEVDAGTNFGQWSPSTWSVFPIQYSNLSSSTAQISWKFPTIPTGGWWNFAFDIYWMNSTWTTKYYNIMIWIYGGTPPGTYEGDVTDGHNTYSYYHGSKSYGPYDVFVLKNRDQIPNVPVQGQPYSITIDIKALMNQVGKSWSSSNPLNGTWLLPDIHLGNENSGSLGSTSGGIEISQYCLNINGNQTCTNSTSPTTTLISPSPTPTFRYVTPTIYCLGSCPTSIPTPIPNSSPTPKSNCPATPSNNTLNWSGYTWAVRSGTGSPGPNNWSTNNVWVDSQCNLHLRIAKANGIWYSSEIDTVTNNFGPGTYITNMVTNPLSPAYDNYTVAGIFYYLDDQDELDIEYSRWGNPGNNNLGQDSVQNSPSVSNPPFYINTPNTTNKMVWSPDGKVYFETKDSSNSIISSWQYSGGHITKSGGGFALNLWLMDGNVPSDGLEKELVISGFSYTPYSATSPTPPQTSNPSPIQPSGTIPTTPVSQTPSASPAPTISTNPCTSITPNQTNAAAANKRRRPIQQTGRGGISGWFAQLLQYLIQLINQLLQLLGIGGIPTPTPTPITEPTLTLTPTQANQPTQPVQSITPQPSQPGTPTLPVCPTNSPNNPSPTITPTPLPKTATINASPASGTLTVNSPTTINVSVNGGGQAFSAVQATVAVSSNLLVTGLSITPSGSAGCNFSYVQTPTAASPSFAGAILGSSSTNCTVYTLTLSPIASGTGTIAFTNALVKAYANSGEILSSVTNGSYIIY